MFLFLLIHEYSAVQGVQCHCMLVHMMAKKFFKWGCFFIFLLVLCLFELGIKFKFQWIFFLIYTQFKTQTARRKENIKRSLKWNYMCVYFLWDPNLFSVGPCANPIINDYFSPKHLTLMFCVQYFNTWPTQ